jgi:uncharacterized membrane protein YoaK (UPF0700 family)
VVAMFVGAIVGALLLKFGMALPLIVSGVCVLAVMLSMSPDCHLRGA